MTHEDHIMETKPGSILFGGFVLMCRNWRCLTWAFFINLVLGAVATVPYIAQTGALLNHSLAARGISGRFDLSYGMDVMRLLNERPSGAWNVAMTTDILFAIVVFIFTPAIFSIYLGDEVASLGNLFRIGLRFFWRMIRLAIVFAIIAGVTIGILSAVRGGLLNKLDDIYVERGYFVWALLTGLVLLAIAIFFRIWADLAQLITVERGTYRIGRLEDRAVRRAIGPAWRLMFAGFLRLYFSFLIVAALGVIGMLVAMLIWHAVPPGSTFLAFVFAQIGLFLFMAARFWTFGVEVAWFDIAGAAFTPQVAPIVSPELPPTVTEPPIEPLPA